MQINGYDTHARMGDDDAKDVCELPVIHVGSVAPAGCAAAHGGLQIPNDPASQVLFALSLVKELASLGGRLVLQTPSGSRPIRASELRERVVAAWLAADRRGFSRKQALDRFPLWVCEATLLEGAWDGVRELAEAPDDQADRTAKGLALLKEAIVGAPDDAVTTNWLLANESSRVKEAMKLLGRPVTARNIGHVLRDLGSAVGIWSVDRRAYGIRWTVGRKPGEASAEEETKTSQGSAAKPRVK